MKPFQLLALLLAAACAQAPAQNNQSAIPPVGHSAAEAEQEQIMARIEHDIRLPGEARALDTYARYYAWHQDKDGARTVVGYYENLTGAAPGRHWVTERDFPLIADGGCGVVSFSYNLASQRIEQVRCNGYA